MYSQLVEFLEKKYRVRDIEPTTNFRDDLGLDSLDMMDLVAFLEDKAGRRVSDAELEAMVTVQDVANFLKRSAG